MTKLWVVIIKDKQMLNEPDIGVCFVEGDDEEPAKAASMAMLAQLANAGRARCVARYVEVQRGQWYRSTMLLNTPWNRTPP